MNGRVAQERQAAVRERHATTPRGQLRASTLGVLGVVVALAALGALLVGSTREGEPAPAEAGGPGLAPDTGDDAPASEPPWALERPPRDTIAVSGPGTVDEHVAEVVRSHPEVATASLVRGAVLGLVRTSTADGTVVDELPAGWWVPVEVLAADPATYDLLLGRTLVADLAPDEVLLGRTSARLRRLAPGATLEFTDGTRLRVAGVVADELIGGAEVLVRADAPLPVSTPRYLLVRPTTPQVALRTVVEDLLGPERPPRIVDQTEVPLLRHAATVLAPARAKHYFGEFTLQDRDGRAVNTGFRWSQSNVRVASVPILGALECHRAVFPPLRAAMQELLDRDLAELVDPDDFGGCWVPRRQHEGGPLSSHAWGIAVDLNVSRNHYGVAPDQPEELIEVMAAHGFTWGGDWLVPDGMHFELAPDHLP